MRYFIPLKAFSSGFESALSESAAGAAGWAVAAGFAALDGRSGLAWAFADIAAKSVTAKTNGAKSGAFTRSLSGPMFGLSPGKKWTVPLW
jgi:hypothetical protein